MSITVVFVRSLNIGTFIDFRRLIVLAPEAAIATDPSFAVGLAAQYVSAAFVEVDFEDASNFTKPLIRDLKWRRSPGTSWTNVAFT
jgi:hypothetical protein